MSGLEGSVRNLRLSIAGYENRCAAAGNSGSDGVQVSNCAIRFCKIARGAAVKTMNTPIFRLTTEESCPIIAY